MRVRGKDRKKLAKEFWKDLRPSISGKVYNPKRMAPPPDSGPLFPKPIEGLIILGIHSSIETFKDM